MKTLIFYVPFHHFFQSGLVNRDNALPELCDFTLVDVDASNVDAGLGKACAGDKAYVSGSNYSYFHEDKLYDLIRDDK